ncbi:MAG TPA: 3-phosphoshikimate 1-carboxyvinyltransferase, partial [Candidatus Polarisedimenticolia bacterium]|nr:3-phosphoshikimate 1-carboxyvinyltransferase [Candidatus Polarisedimenticolia bacterium]
MNDERAVPTVSRPLDGSLTAPPSKSVTQRALVAAALAAGQSHLRRPLLADDSRRLIAALEAVGIPVAISGQAADGGPAVEIEGQAGAIPESSA